MVSATPPGELHEFGALVAAVVIAEDATLEEWKERPSQVEVARGDLVATVRAMLEAH